MRLSYVKKIFLSLITAFVVFMLLSVAYYESGFFLMSVEGAKESGLAEYRKYETKLGLDQMDLVGPIVTNSETAQEVTLTWRPKQGSFIIEVSVNRRSLEVGIFKKKDDEIGYERLR